MRLKNSRGITPIISVILILMITIAVAGLAYTWLQGLQSSVQTSTENRTSRMLGNLNVELKLDSAELRECDETHNGANVTVYYRNSGTEAATNVLLFVNDKLISGANDTSLSAGSTANFTAPGVAGLTNVTWINTSRTFRIESDAATAEESFRLTCP